MAGDEATAEAGLNDKLPYDPARIGGVALRIAHDDHLTSGARHAASLALDVTGTHGSSSARPPVPCR